MRKLFLLMLTLYSIFNCRGQQKHMDSLLNELSKHPQEDTLRIRLLLDVAADYESIQPAKGAELCKKAIELSKKLNSAKSLARSYLVLAQNYQTLGKDSIAITLCNQSLTIDKYLNDSLAMAAVYQSTGVIYFDYSEYFKAISYEQHALDIVKKLNDVERQADMLNSLGVDYQFMGDYPTALKYFQQAIDIWNQHGHTDLTANAITNIGLLYNDMKDYKKALEYHKKAFAINDAAGNKTNVADCYGNMATVYDENGDTTNSRFYYKKALQLSEKVFYDYGMISAKINLGISYTNTNNYDSSLTYLTQALQKLRMRNDKTNTSITLDYLSYCYIHAPDDVLKKFKITTSDKFSKAIELEVQSIQLATAAKNKYELNQAYENLSDIYETKKDYAKALQAYKKSVDFQDSVFNDNTKQQITRLEMQYDFNKTQDSIKAINDKQKAIAQAEIQKQKFVKNSTMAATGFLLLAGVGGFIFYKRNRNIKLQKNQAELSQQITETEMKALRAQMNPHFIFNSLNSIADYIDKNQATVASDFAVKFAKLMRMVLENSEQKSISLSDDLKALELYMQLEQLRLKNKFTYEVKVDENIDKENTLVPPLILQPFVENSIWHGIANKQGNGQITIYIKQEGDMINCIVEDDGEGIKVPGNQTQEKKSLGMKITKARIDIINKIKNTNASVKITSKKNGVRAEVKLPLELSF